MRVLWFSVTPSLFHPLTNGHNGAGWIGSLEAILRQSNEVQLGVAFEFPDRQFKYEKDRVSYYPINNSPKYYFLQQILCSKNQVNQKIEHCLKIIDDFKPDVIQIFGTENDFGLICKKTKVPVVIHIQGSIYIYLNSIFPVGINKYDFLMTKGLTLMQRYVGLNVEKKYRKRGLQELEIIRSCNYFMGRTHWDQNLVELFHPGATYFKCEEALRDSFLQNKIHWEYKNQPKVKIISVISKPWYKGVDLILKTASLLKYSINMDFEWNVYGVSNISFFENKYKIKADEVNINVMGVASKDKLVDAICHSSCYVHPSYIDNSPNSICEAQILGIPVLSTNVGGISSIIDDGNTGLLFPANDPYTLSSLIRNLSQNEELAKYLSENERKIAFSRHDSNKILNSLLTIYKIIINR